jgi:SAM-dependent methyltransferase
MMQESYHSTRFGFDERREVLWRTLCKYYFSKVIRADSSVLEIGVGYGHFINNIDCVKKFAVDSWENFPKYINPGVHTRVCNAWELDFVENRSIDFVFASNVFEHLTREQFAQTLAVVKQKLKPGGSIIILQPNYRFAFREYFDDYTHISIYSDISICDFIESNGFQILERRPRFLPFTLKSRLPVFPLLIRLYLIFPIKPFAKQMLVRACPRF